MNPDALKARLAELPDPHTGHNMGSAIKAVAVDKGNVAVEVQMAYPAQGWLPSLEARIAEIARESFGAAQVRTLVQTRVASHRVQKDLTPLPGVKNILAVASGKGGVGKSTTAVNLALALQAEGARVGILDADIHGPSIPMMLGLQGKPESPDGKAILPKHGHGLQAMSIGFFLGEDTPTIWRGPMTTQYLQQLLTTTLWEDLDYLLIDLPPGTGDIQLTLAQRVPVSAAVIVTTPQDIALIDAKKALKMFEKVEVPVLGIIENMAVHVCKACGHEEHIFGSGGADRMAAQYDVPVLGSLPLRLDIREQADGGRPSVAADADGDVAQRYRAIARRCAGLLSLQARNKAIGFPNIVIQNT